MINQVCLLYINRWNIVITDAKRQKTLQNCQNKPKIKGKIRLNGDQIFPGMMHAECCQLS